MFCHRRMMQNRRIEKRNVESSLRVTKNKRSKFSKKSLFKSLWKENLFKTTLYKENIFKTSMCKKNIFKTSPSTITLFEINLYKSILEKILKKENGSKVQIDNKILQYLKVPKQLKAISQLLFIKTKLSRNAIKNSRLS